MDENKRYHEITTGGEGQIPQEYTTQGEQQIPQEYTTQSEQQMPYDAGGHTGYGIYQHTQQGYTAYQNTSGAANNMYENNNINSNVNNNVNGMAAWYASEQMGQAHPNTEQPITQKLEHKKNSGSTKKSTPDKKNKKKGFGIKLLQVSAAAVVFGLVAGAVFQGVRLATDRFTGRNGNSEKAITAGAEAENETVTEKAAENTTEEANKPYVGASSNNVINTTYDVADVAEKVMPSIVSITGTYVTTYDYWFNSYEAETPGAGSGIIIGKDNDYLYVLTNYHVVEDAKELSVSFIDDKVAEAEVKGYDEQHDTAIVLVELKNIEADTLNAIKEIQIGSSDNLRAGDPCIAIGNALGYGQSVTVGYISALERELSVSDGTVKVLQTDAAINPGNSGGALVNMNGELIGVNTAKYVDSKVEGMGYALPISDIQDIINNLIESDSKTVNNTKTGDAYLGISAQTITDEYSELLGMPKGIYISSVEDDSAAKECGLQSGDVILGFDGKEVTDMETLHDMVVSHKAGDEVEIEYYRNNNGKYEKKTTKATLKEKK